MSRPLQRILYAEDEPDIRAIVRVSLERIGGYELKVCSSGMELIEALETFTPDLILLDVMMPDFDGPQTLSSLRQHDIAASIPVLFITAKSQASEIAQLKSLGAIDVLQKPFDPMTLADQIQSIWNRYQHDFA